MAEVWPARGPCGTVVGTAMLRLALLLLLLLLLAVTLTAAVAAPAHAAQGDLAFFDCAGQGTFGCTDLNPTAGVLDDATAVLVVGNRLYTTASGSNAIARFGRAANGSLVYVDCVGQGSFGCTNIADDAIGGARALAADPDGEDVYVAGYRSDAVAAFRRDTTTGTLTYADCVGQGATGCTDVSATARPFDGSSGVAVSPDGLEVYVVADRGNALAELDRTDATGAIAFAACDAQGGAFGCDDVGLTAAPLDRPSGVVVGPDGQQVFVVARDSASLAAFDRGPGGDLAFGSCIGQGTFGCATDITATAFVLYARRLWRSTPPAPTSTRPVRAPTSSGTSSSTRRPTPCRSATARGRAPSAASLTTPRSPCP